MYIVKIKINRGEKVVNEMHLVRCELFEQIPATLAKELNGYEYEIVSASKRKCEILYNYADMFFCVRYKMITIDEVTAKEKKTTAEILVNAETLDEAKSEFQQWTKDSVSDIEIVSIKATNIISVING